MREFIVHKNTKNAADYKIGGKASNLLKLEKLGSNIPKWLVIPSEVLGNNLAEIENGKGTIDLKPILNQIENYFGSGFQIKTYAVRSSALDEDGSKYSFAGQFDTFLHVPPSQLEDKIISVWKSVLSDRVTLYRKENNLAHQTEIGIIIQEMISPEVAGVAFGMDPVSGDNNTVVISSVYGLGEGLVSGELDADTFKIKSEEIEKTIANKTHQFVRNNSGNGICKIEVEKSITKNASLNKKQLLEIEKLLIKLKNELGNPQDIEFALENDKLYLLQTRPITTNAKSGEYILWDNSNITESYPGITTPLTFSFILKMYERVYRQFVGLLGVNENEINAHENVFANTLGLVRGRVYYNLLSWYKMLAMLPGYSLNAEYMENMMGVKERFELQEDYKMGKGMAWVRIVFMLLKMFSLQKKLPKERKRFMKHLNKTMAFYNAIEYEKQTATKIISHYKTFEKNLLLEWKAPLINDFFAMIWFGMLQKLCAKTTPEEPNIHNDLLCGSQDIISVEPIHRSMEIASLIIKNIEASELFKNQSPQDIWKVLNSGKFPEILASIDEYILKFGERCVGELKLETISYSQDPALFIKIIKAYVTQNISRSNSNSSLDLNLRENAENKINFKLKGSAIKKWWLHLVLNKARDMVSNRENLRYERTRGFGMVRKMFSALGIVWHKAGFLDDPRDIFYLELSEIKELETKPFSEKHKEEIKTRKAEFSDYKKQEIPQERFFTYGNNFEDSFIYSSEKIEPIEGELSGIGCCPGRVKARVQVILDPNDIDSLNGDVLVTSSTDPGWVTLFPTASAIIVERGSLLSHSAIVSREMGIPCIVSVSRLLRTLKTGDQIEMDGSTGEIKIVSNG